MSVSCCVFSWGKNKVEEADFMIYLDSEPGRWETSGFFKLQLKSESDYRVMLEISQNILTLQRALWNQSSFFNELNINSEMLPELGTIKFCLHFNQVSNN